MLNHITIMGRLTRDPELRRTGTGVAVANFSVACDRDFSGGNGGEKETDFIDCVAWRNNGEYIAKYFTKGRMIVVSGRLQIRTWTDKDGNKQRTAEIVVENAYFGDSKKENPNGQGTAGYGAPQASGYGAPAPGYGAQAPGYGAPAPGYGAQAPGYGNPAPGYGAPAHGYAAPAAGYGAPQAPASEFEMLNDDDAQLPF